MSNEQLYESEMAEYGASSNHADFGDRTRAKAQARTKPNAKRRGKAPQSVNGMHRRRRRKMAW